MRDQGWLTHPVTMLLMENLKSRVERNKEALIEHAVAGTDPKFLAGYAAELKAYRDILSGVIFDD